MTEVITPKWMLVNVAHDDGTCEPAMIRCSQVTMIQHLNGKGLADRAQAMVMLDAKTPVRVRETWGELADRIGSPLWPKSKEGEA